MAAGQLRGGPLLCGEFRCGRFFGPTALFLFLEATETFLFLCLELLVDLLGFSNLLLELGRALFEHRLVLVDLLLGDIRLLLQRRHPSLIVLELLDARVRTLGFGVEDGERIEEGVIGRAHEELHRLVHTGVLHLHHCDGTQLVGELVDLALLGLEIFRGARQVALSSLCLHARIDGFLLDGGSLLLDHLEALLRGLDGIRVSGGGVIEGEQRTHHCRGEDGAGELHKHS